VSLWRRLAIFPASFAREALDAAATDDDLTAAGTSAQLTTLIDRGIVLVDEGESGTRYRLPELARPTARALLVESGEEEAVYERLVAFYTALAMRSLDEAFGPERSTWMQRLELEHPNLRAVLEWLAAQEDARRGLDLTFALGEMWFEEAYTSEGRLWFDRFLALPGLPEAAKLRARALDLAGALALNEGAYAEARRLKDRGLAILRELGEPVAIGYALLHLGHLVGSAQGDFAGARAIYQEALDLLQEADHAAGIAHALGNLSKTAIALGEFDTARVLVEDSLQRYRSLGYRHEMAVSVRRAAGVAAGMGHPEPALRLGGAGTALCEAIGVSQPAVFEQRFEEMLDPARNILDSATEITVWEEGRALTLKEAVAYALEVLSSLRDSGTARPAPTGS
jgi:tetratricopeptide (TPR) repeat protein